MLYYGLALKYPTMVDHGQTCSSAMVVHGLPVLRQAVFQPILTMVNHGRTCAI